LFYLLNDYNSNVLTNFLKIFKDPNLSTKSEKRREETETELENELMAEFVRVSLKQENDFNVRFRKKTFSKLSFKLKIYNSKFMLQNKLFKNIFEIK